VRKYRGQAQELERQLGQRDRRVAALEAEVARLDAAVQVRGALPPSVAAITQHHSRHGSSGCTQQQQAAAAHVACDCNGRSQRWC
jgi:hypothetical protein